MSDQSVPLVVLIVGLVILLAIRPIAISSRTGRSKRTPSPGPEAIEQLAEHLGVGILVESVEAGPPARIVASGLLDGGRTRLEGSGPTEEDAWRDLARAAIAWKREDGRNVRFWWGA
ncbi:MAG TPA: hypothetical protein VHK05_05520 [Candidatus Limnocylindrales bacterium]|nr:hypothetical protein [Candidatus Limnocylindrales bacterium]